jgi:hypothetical protein
VIPIAPNMGGNGRAATVSERPASPQPSPIASALDLLRAAAHDSTVTKAAQDSERARLSKAADDALDDNYISLPIPQPVATEEDDD